jgi:propionate CoA-transferase
MKSPPRLMDERIFRPAPMGLRSVLLRLRLSDRFSHDVEKNMFLVNFEGLDIATREDVEAIYREVESRLSHISLRPYAIVNYDNFSIRPEAIDNYSDMVSTLMSRFYSGVTRYTTSSFLRMKLGNALNERGVSSYIYESPEEAKAQQDSVEPRPRMH